jgi:hypothetical protein
VVGLLAAQLLSGLSLTAFEGTTDARIARDLRPGDVTTGLALSTATRALGSSLAVRFLPLIVAAPAIGWLSAVLAGVLATGGTVTILAARTLEAAPGAVRPASAPPG